ncbi:MAG: riboflavin kinase [Candidatus Latescibacterota bacterium]
MSAGTAVLRGRVGRGDGRGRQLGFPTANLQLDRTVVEALRPGVWAALARWDGPAPRGAVVNAGTRPTFAGGVPVVEVHVLDFAGDLYGCQVEVELLGWIRPEQRFPSVSALVAQIRLDVEVARRLIQEHARVSTVAGHQQTEGGKPSGNQS